MARAGSPRGLSPFRRSPTSTHGNAGDTQVVPASGCCGDCPRDPVITPEDAERSGVDAANISALETIADALFRAGVPDDLAVEVFDRAFGWAIDSADRWRVAS